MEKERCFEISFPFIDFDIYMTGHEKSSSIHHAHLICRENEIEVKIFYESKTYFGNKLSYWASSINWKNFGSFLKIQNEKQDRLQKIDLSQSALLKVTTGSNQYERGLQFVSLLVNSAKFYWDPNEEEINTSEFYLNDVGFHVIKQYYAPLFGQEEEFEITRMNGLSDFYVIEQAKYRPEFNFLIQDSRNSREAKIVKEPKFQFKYEANISEAEAFRYADTVRLLTSFFYRTNLTYILSRVNLKDYTITLKRIQTEENSSEPFGNLWAFGCQLNYDLFMKSNWQSIVQFNLKKLTKVIEMFIQSISVDNSSKFLLMYNIIEVCMSGTKFSAEKFENILEESQIQENYNASLNLLLQTIKPEDHQDFTNKWSYLKGKLVYKPMKSPLSSFLENQNLNPADFPISLDDLKDIRDKITHGSINKIKDKQLDNANILLYRISGILILNLIGIKEWKLDTKLPD